VPLFFLGIDSLMPKIDISLKYFLEKAAIVKTGSCSKEV
jgi:hypothetical protein